MKQTKIAYWICTILISGLMAFSAFPDIVSAPEAVKFMSGLGYPPYLLPFLGIAKTLGVIAILIPGFPKVKEWAYAGLFFDLAGATWSIIAIGTAVQKWIFMPVFMLVLLASYFLYHRIQRYKATTT
jgi:uncharacterized membrane protein YphA (DoxX/SURF4 family)